MILDADGKEILDPETQEFQTKFWMGVALEAFGALIELTPMPGQRWKSIEAAQDYRTKVAKYIYEHLPPGSAEARFKRKGFVFHDGPPPSSPADVLPGARDN